jgi:hypothetical protein
MSAHRTTRRAMLAGAATLSATTAIVTGAAISAPVGDDPIFAAIEAHRRANRAFAEAVTAADLPGAGRPDARIIIGHHKGGEWTRTDHDDGGITLRFIPADDDLPLYADYPEEIERSAPKDLQGADREAWIAERKGKLEKEQERLDEEYEQTERGKLDVIRREADDLEHERLWDLIWTMPTTLAGIAALKAYVRKSGGRSELVPEEDWSAALDWTIEKAVCAIKGLPEPPMDKAVASLWDTGEEVAS